MVTWRPQLATGKEVRMGLALGNLAKIR